MGLSIPPVQPGPALASKFNADLSLFGEWATTIPAQLASLAISVITTTSTSSVSITKASKTFVLAADRPIIPGMILMFWNNKTAWMIGRVTSYNSGTKTVAADVKWLNGSGSFASWTISLHTLPPFMPNALADRVRLTGGNSLGSSNYIRRFATTVLNVGSAITYTDDPTYGAKFTINKADWYGIDYQDQNTDAALHYMGLSANTIYDYLPITSNPNNDPYRLAVSYMSDGTGTGGGSVQALKYLNVGDVIRPHLDITTTGLATSARAVSFDIFRVAA